MTKPLAISIRGGRVIDPANRIDRRADLHLDHGRVVAVGEAPAGFTPSRVIQVPDWIVCPGFIDLSAHLREPGLEHKATIRSETRAAAASGITTLCCPPDTAPVIDTPAVAQLIQQTAQRHGHARVLPIGAMTRGLEGSQITEMAALRRAGCPVLGQADRPIRNVQVQRRAMEYAATFGLTLFLHPQDPDLAFGGCAHEGHVSTRLGLPGIPEAAETVAIARDLALAGQSGARIHFRGLSSALAATILTLARQHGVRASGDVSIHQLFLTEHDLDGFDANYHLIPPLRTQADREGLRRAVATGELAAICSDHQPHDADAKLRPFPETAPGITGLETLLPLVLRLVSEGLLELPDAIARLTSGPAEIIGRDLGHLTPGAAADICIFDPDACWTPSAETLLTQGRNSPFLGQGMRGRVMLTLLQGRIVFERQSGH
ncbi:MAG: dihydroorotase [Sphingobacteriia bacterium]|nr:dihydroorotase [Sphingobacteriia bacterium]NCC38359.1 dihydroorotase [Gammaproteobacteria bacterium]